MEVHKQLERSVCASNRRFKCIQPRNGSANYLIDSLTLPCRLIALVVIDWAGLTADRCSALFISTVLCWCGVGWLSGKLSSQSKKAGSQSLVASSEGVASTWQNHFEFSRTRNLNHLISNEVGGPPELKHITKGRKRN